MSDYLEELFDRVAEANCSWHGLYQDREDHTWNVRLLLEGEPNPGHFAYGKHNLLAVAICDALIQVQHKRAWRAKPKLTVVTDRRGNVEAAIALIADLTPEELHKLIEDVTK